MTVCAANEERFKKLQKSYLPPRLKYSVADLQPPLSVKTSNKFDINDYKGKLLEQRLTQRSKTNLNNSLHRLVSEESGITIGSRASSGETITANNKGNIAASTVGRGAIEKKSLSRGVRLLQLGNQKAEMRKTAVMRHY